MTVKNFWTLKCFSFIKEDFVQKKLITTLKKINSTKFSKVLRISKFVNRRNRCIVRCPKLLNVTVLTPLAILRIMTALSTREVFGLPGTSEILEGCSQKIVTEIARECHRKNLVLSAKKYQTIELLKNEKCIQYVIKC